MDLAIGLIIGFLIGAVVVSFLLRNLIKNAHEIYEISDKRWKKGTEEYKKAVHTLEIQRDEFKERKNRMIPLVKIIQKTVVESSLDPEWKEIANSRFNSALEDLN